MAIIKKGYFVERETLKLQISDQPQNVVDQALTNGLSNNKYNTNYEPPKQSEIPANNYTGTSLGASYDNSALILEKKQIEQEITALRLKSENDVREMMEQARVEVEDLKRAAKAEGAEAAKRELISRYEEKFAELGQAIKSIMDDKKKLIRESEGELLKLSIKIAEQIIRSEISLNQGIALNIVAEAITKITDRDKVIVKVSRSDFDYVQKNKDRMMALMDDLRNLLIQEDSSIEPGGCLIETDLGYVDSRVSVKLESIKNALMKQFNENMAAGIEPDLRASNPTAARSEDRSGSNQISKAYSETQDDDDDEDIFNFDDDDDDDFFK